MTRRARSEREPWLAIRRDLSPGRQAFLTAFSFLLPLGLWCFVSYVPFVWHPDIKLEIGGMSGNTVYTAGDRLGKDFFPEVAEGVRQENRALAEALATGEKETVGRRTNEKILRYLAQIAIDNGLLADELREDVSAIYGIWGQVARDPGVLQRVPLAPENIDIVRRNWAMMEAVSPTYDPERFPDSQLFCLVPQGRPSNPVYLPAPDEVVRSGIRDWKRVDDSGKATLAGKYQLSLGVVFRGFLLAAMLAVPIGLLSGTYCFFGKLVEPFTDFFRYMPAPAFSTLLVAVLGAHEAPKVALIFIGTFPHLVLMVTKTAALLEPALIEAAQTLGAKRFQLFRRVVVPGTLPFVYNDLRIALGWAWTWLVIAELIGVKSGLTEVIDTQGVRRNFDRVFPVIILIGMTGFFTDQILSWLRPRIFRWLGERSGAPSLPGRVFRGFAKWLEPAVEAHRKPAGTSSFPATKAP